MRQLPVAFCMLLAGCAPGASDVIAKHRGAAQQRLDAIQGLATRIEKTALGPDRITLPPDVTLDFGNTGGSKGNTRLMHAEGMANPGALSLRIDLGSELLSYKRVIDWLKVTDSNSLDASLKVPEVERTFAEIEAVRFILVLRTRRALLPRILGDGSFETGSIEGEALLVDLDSGECLGGFRFTGKNSPEVTISQSAPLSTLDGDLRLNARKAIAGRLSNLAPGTCFDPTVP